MGLYLDSAEIKEIKTGQDWGFLSGITTNPVLVSQAMKKAKLGRKDYPAFLKKLSTAIKGTTFIQPIAEEEQALMEEAALLNSLFAQRLVLKIPFSPLGLKVTPALKKLGLKVAITAIFTPLQALLSAECRADLVIPFCSRIGKLGFDGVATVLEIMEIFRQREIHTEVLAASIKSQAEAAGLLNIGVRYLTLPFSIYEEIFAHPQSAELLTIFRQSFKF
jgi:transaldolase